MQVQKPDFENYCFFCNRVVKLTCSFVLYNFDLIDEEYVFKWIPSPKKW